LYNKNRSLSLIISFIIILVLPLIYYNFLVKDSNSLFIISKENIEIEQLWEDKKYGQIIDLTQEILKEDALNSRSLFYGGISYFYLSMQTPDNLKKQSEYRDKAIELLRKYLLLPYASNKEDVYYVLGMVYFYKGYYFKDLSIEFLEKAKKIYSKDIELLTYLALVYIDTKEYNKSNEIFLKILYLDSDNENKDLIYIKMIDNYLKLKDSNSVKTYLDKLPQETTDESILEKYSLIKASIYIDDKDLDAAEQEYKNILERNPNSIDAHYLLGELYEMRIDNIKARAEWREVIKIDKNNLKALSKLQMQ